jgi:hypothetical protein
MGMQWPGDENLDEEVRFRFVCEDDPDCPGHNKFHIRYEEPPTHVPSSIQCPYGNDHESSWCMDGVANSFIRGQTMAGVKNEHYTRDLADAEHKWMELQIEETKKAVNAEDQIEGTAVSPYSKKVLNVEKALETGMIKKLDEEAAAEKKRITDERARIVADQAKDKITREIDKKHVGRRHDG